MSFWSTLARRVGRALIPHLTRAISDKLSGTPTRSQRDRPAARPGNRSDASRPARPGASAPQHPGPTSAYPGDFRGTPQFEYAPNPNGEANPGEIVWTWVPYEEDHSQGKDRPVLIIGRDARWFLALQLTSKDHDVDAKQEARAGRYWQDIGTGPWDKQGRPSEVRVNRIIRVAPDAVRREGAVLDRATFDQVANAVRKHNR
ncbi:type II toxin-antitoxin system PemK/MazF family toxin [Gulosibacter bifidus]|uniref:Type II toxin-antitoxin system PemK/MazF family toxin n=1 Tax=Gulosibacter bifidus TaxID=272239 RepID=A0ABW5RGP8_9MICO|nr:type II toxin-antitoxin system PemK/MazF family toxin [Gulosibacter bifidus]